jgi:GNAT superfamily N-acetyltransferase
VDIREIDPHDETLVRRHWEIGREAEAERPYDFYVPWELARRTYAEGRDDIEMVLLGAFDAGEMWGAARVDVNRYDNLDLGSATYYTHPDRRRRGIGRALAAASYDVARARGCTQLVTEAYAPLDAPSAGLLFGEAMGFTPAIFDGMKVVDLVETEPSWAALEEAVAPRHAGYHLVAWRDGVPDELVEGYCRLNEMFFEQAPMGELDMEPEKWDEARVRKREAHNARLGRHDAAAGAIAPDGALVGFTEVFTSDHAPWRGIQSGTLVDPDHRGHALGLAIKLLNHRQLRDHFPQCRVLLTGNADVNAAMNSVNDALGYREVERCVEMQRPL